MLDPSIAWKAIAEYGIAVVALVFLAGFAFWLVKTGMADLRTSRDRALDISDRQVGQTEKLTEAVNRLADRLERDADRRR